MLSTDLLTQTFDPEIEVEEEDIVVELMRTWQNERHAPELLPYPASLLQQMRELLLNQADVMDEQSGTKASEVAFFHKIYRLEMDRLRWIISSLLQCRLQKIENYWLFYFRLEEEMRQVFLGPEETDYLKKFANLKVEHAQRTLLHHIDAIYPGMEGSEDVDIPRLSAMVVARVRRSLGKIFVDEEEIMFNEAAEGTVLVLPYRVIRPYLFDASVELI